MNRTLPWVRCMVPAVQQFVHFRSDAQHNLRLEQPRWTRKPPVVPPTPIDDGPRGWSLPRGDKTAYETLLRDCIPFIKQVARGQGVRADCIDDIVQETLITIHRARQTYDPNRSFTAWLRMIAQRRAVDGLRRGGRSDAHEVHAPLAYENHPDSSGDPEEAASELDRAALLGASIATLSARQREAVEHLALRDHSLAQAAAATGRTTGSLRVNWHRAIKTLRVQLGGKD